MKRAKKQPFDLGKARREQQALSRRVSLADSRESFELVAGIDVHYAPDGSHAQAGAALYSLPKLELLAEATARSPIPMPYVPGYLSFREAPAALAALGRLPAAPQVVLCDGQGIAHPARFGLACHVGVKSGLPTVGAAKSRLVGEYKEPPRRKGGWTPLIYQDQVVGAVLRTREGVKPLFVSPGHGLSLPTAITLILAAISRFRIPEPLRRAHQLAGRWWSRPCRPLAKLPSGDY